MQRSSLVSNSPPGLISEQEFKHQTEPSQVKIKVVKYDKKLIGTSHYVLQIEIGEQKVFAESRRTFDEVRSFHNVLS
jgi:hypothetical protein